MLEKTFANQEMFRWKGNIPVEYLYTTGIAGEQFFRTIKEKGKIMGTACTKCRLAYLPPRLFCEKCFSPLKTWKAAPKQGSVFTYTVNSFDVSGQPIHPIIIALVKFKGFHGGIIHRIEETSAEEMNIGMPVTPVLEDVKKRTGAISDIKYFKPA